MPTTVTLHRWDEIALEKVTEMISRKIITGEREMVTQIYLKRGAIVPMSRGILFASAGTDYADSARVAALRYRDAINALRPEPATTRG